MSNNVLQQIIDKKKLKLEKLKNEISLENINDQIEKNNNFVKMLVRGDVHPNATDTTSDSGAARNDAIGT